jgi:pimeloyl-ACP methyl ester carboxylesterase
VVLVHGLWLGRSSLAPWRWQFERRGLEAIAFGYPSRASFADNAKRLYAFIATLPAQEVHCMGHSLGGLLILELLRQGAENGNGAVRKIARAVLAGAPVAGSMGASRFAKSRLGHWMVGGAISALETRAPPACIATHAEIGVIAGTGGRGLGRISGKLPAPNDGAITVAETTLAGARDAITLPVSHSAMLLSSAVVAQACSFFATGRFTHHD